MSGCEQDQFSAGISENCEKIVHGSRTSPRTDRDTLKLGDLAVRPEGLEGRTAIFSQLRKDKKAGHKSSSFLFATPRSFTASTRGQV